MVVVYLLDTKRVIIIFMTHIYFIIYFVSSLSMKYFIIKMKNTNKSMIQNSSHLSLHKNSILDKSNIILSNER